MFALYRKRKERKGQPLEPMAKRRPCTLAPLRPSIRGFLPWSTTRSPSNFKDLMWPHVRQSAKTPPFPRLDVYPRWQFRIHPVVSLMFASCLCVFFTHFFCFIVASSPTFHFLDRIWNHPFNWIFTVFIFIFFRKEYPPQHVFIRRNGRFELFEDIGHWIRQLQQTSNESNLSERYPSRFLQLHAPGKIDNFKLKILFTKKFFYWFLLGVLERGIPNGVAEFPNARSAVPAQSGQIRI